MNLKSPTNATQHILKSPVCKSRDLVVIYRDIEIPCLIVSQVTFLFRMISPIISCAVIEGIWTYLLTIKINYHTKNDGNFILLTL